MTCGLITKYKGEASNHVPKRTSLVCKQLYYRTVKVATFGATRERMHVCEGRLVTEHML